MKRETGKERQIKKTKTNEETVKRERQIKERDT